MNFEEKQREALEAIIDKGYQECRKHNIVNDLSRGAYLQKIACELSTYYGFEATGNFFKTPYDLINALVDILSQKVATLEINTEKIGKLLKTTDNSTTAWQYIAAATVRVFQNHQVLSKFVSLRELSNFLRSPR